MPATAHELKRVGSRRAGMVGRPEVDIRLGNPSPHVGSGTIPSIKPGEDGRSIWYRGRLGQEVLLLQMVDRDVLTIVEDAPAFTWSDGRAHYAFRPTYVCEHVSGRRTIVEPKWASDVVKFDLRPVYGLVRAYARRVGYDDLELWTDVQTRRPGRLANAGLLYAAAADRPKPELIEAMLVAAHAAGGAVAVGSLRRACLPAAKTFRAALRLIWSGDLLRADTERLIDDATVVTARSLKP